MRRLSRAAQRQLRSEGYSRASLLRLILADYLLDAPEVTLSQLRSKRCRNLRNRSESLRVLRFVRLAPKSALPASARDRVRRQTPTRLPFFAVAIVSSLLGSECRKTPLSQRSERPCIQQVTDAPGIFAHVFADTVPARLARKSREPYKAPGRNAAGNILAKTLVSSRRRITRALQLGQVKLVARTAVADGRMSGWMSLRSDPVSSNRCTLIIDHLSLPDVA
jgi:hypothetical protein